MLITYIKTHGGPDAPFIPLPKKSLKRLVEILEINEMDVVYELGCGDGRVLHELYKVKNVGTYIGIERNLVVYCIAYIRTKFFTTYHTNSTIKIVYGDIFNQELQDATLIIMYLFPEVMDDLLPKLKSELRKGTLLYSVSFQFRGKDPKMVVPLLEGKAYLAREVYVYEF